MDASSTFRITANIKNVIIKTRPPKERRTKPVTKSEAKLTLKIALPENITGKTDIDAANKFFTKELPTPIFLKSTNLTKQL